MLSDQESTNKIILAHWAALDQGLQSPDRVKPISGYHLDIATVVLVARYVIHRRQISFTNLSWT